jgi:hypothetical protein
MFTEGNSEGTAVINPTVDSPFSYRDEPTSLRRMFLKDRVLKTVAVAASSLVVASCADESPPLPQRQDMTVGAEVFQILCKRVASSVPPEEYAKYPGIDFLSGVQFNAFCDGSVAPDESLEPRFVALIKRRQELVAALDQVFGDAPTDGSADFGGGELDKFLADLIPFYDPPEELTPKATRAIGQVMAELLADKPISQEVLKTLERVAPRVGYRRKDLVLGAVRPALTYPGLDELSRTFLKLLAEGGVGHDTFLALLRAGALELAEPSDGTPPEDTTLRAALDLLFAMDDELGTGTPLWVVDRDARGYAKTQGVGAPFVDADGDGLADVDEDGFVGQDGKVPTPFARAVDGDSSPNHGGDGRAVGPNGLLYKYIDADKTVLAGLMRDAYPLLERPSETEPSTVEKVARGLRPILGPTADRTEAFNDGAATLNYRGPQVENSPLLDLVHGITTLAKYPETDRMLALLDYLLRPQDGESEEAARARESDALALVYAALRLDEIADEYPDAKLIGWDGRNETNEFWDDIIEVGQRILQRDGQLEAVLRSFTGPEAVAATQLIAKFMKYKDHVSYNGAPLSLQSDGKYSQADANRFNSEVQHVFSDPVDRTQPDVGMNRSLWQRLISTIHATNGAANCNRAGAVLNVRDPLIGAALTFPDPTGQPPKPGNALECAAWSVIDLACGPGAGHNHGSCLLGTHRPHNPAPTYQQCAFVRQPNGAESHMRAILGRSRVVLKDSQLLCLENAGLAGDLGETQETEAQIRGFKLTLTPQAIARFIHVPRNKFLSDLFAPFPSVHGVPLAEFEPDILFALEMKQPDVLLNGNPQSFLTASLPLTKAFDDHELFEKTEDGDVATRGYMFAELLATLHMHWPSPRIDPDTGERVDCPPTVQPGDEGCSQSRDPSRPFYAHQSNLVSYEEFLIRALEEEKLGEILQKAAAHLTGFTMDGKDGVTILADFVKVLITPEAGLTYRDGRDYAKTNACVEEMTPEGELGCVDGRGRIIEGGVPPIYLVLDALKEIDQARDQADQLDRKPIWLEARSKLVDHFLTVTRDDTDPEAPLYALKNKVAKRVALHLVPWVRERMAAHPLPPEDPALRDPRVEYRDAWVERLPTRLADVLGHPVTAAVLDLLDVVWDEEKAGAEFAKVAAYLMDPNRDAFAGMVVAAADTLMLLDRDPDLTPLVQFAALALAPNVFDVLNGGSGGDLKVTDGAVYRGLELTRRIAELSSGPEPSTISKLLKNAVLPNAEGESPLEILIDGAAEVNRADPRQPSDKPLLVEDYRSVFRQVMEFLTDEDRGMERLYKVIQGRELSKGQAN